MPIWRCSVRRVCPKLAVQLRQCHDLAMYDVTPLGFPFIFVMVYLVVIAAIAFGAYWLIRLAVRHGLRDHSKWLWKIGLTSPQKPQAPEEPAL